MGALSVYKTPAGACSPSSSPRFHHDDANSGDFTRDAVSPGKPMDAAISRDTLTFKAPGDDLLCGTATSYQVVTSNNPITPENFDQATAVNGAPGPAAPGTAQTFALPPGVGRYIAIRAEDDQHNIGLPAVADRGGGSRPIG